MPLNFYATFTNGTNNGVTGLVPLITITKIALSTGTNTNVLINGTMSPVTNCSGMYFYNMTASADLTSFDYAASITTNSTVSVDTPFAASLWSNFGTQAVTITPGTGGGGTVTAGGNSVRLPTNMGSLSISNLGFLRLTDACIEDIWLFTLSAVNYDPTDVDQSIGGVIYELHSMYTLGIGPGYQPIFKAEALVNVPAGSATANALAVWNFLAANATVNNSMGEELLAGSGGLSGPAAITVNFSDSTHTGVPNVDFTIVGQGSARGNSLGVATFGLPVNTTSGYRLVPRITNNVILPVTDFTVSGTTTVTIVGTGVPVPTMTADQCYGVLQIIDGAGAVEADITVTFQGYAPPVDGVNTGYLLDPITSDPSDANGIITQVFPVGAVRYRWKRGSGPWQYFDTGLVAGAAFDIVSNIGTP